MTKSRSLLQLHLQYFRPARFRIQAIITFSFSLPSEIVSIFIRGKILYKLQLNWAYSENSHVYLLLYIHLFSEEIEGNYYKEGGLGFVAFFFL